MPANATIKQALDAALRAANEGHQSMAESGPVFDKTMTAAMATKHMGGTIIKVWKSGPGTAYWQVPIREGAVTKTGAEYKIAINESGNDSAGAMKKLSELLGGEWKVMGAVRAVLCSAQGVPGERATLSVTGIAATLTPKAGAQLTHLTLSVGDAQSNLGVEAALTAANLEWESWEGCTPQEALVPVGNSMPTVAGARAKAATLADIAGSDNFKAQAAAKAMGIASATTPSDFGSVAAIAAHWAGFGEATDAVAVVLGIDPQASPRCARAHPLAGGVIAALRDALAALTSEQMAEVAELTAKLAAVGVTPSGAHIGMWLMGLAPSLDATRPTGVILDPQPPLGMATAVSACHAEAVRRVAEVADLSDATKATMVTALSAQLLAEGWGAEAVATATVGLDPVRIKGAERLPPNQVLEEIATAINKSAADVIASISGARGATNDERSAMFLTATRVAERAADDLFFMATRSGTRFEAQPTSWAEAAGRVGEIMSAFNRTRKAADDGPPATESAATRLARRLSGDDHDSRRVVSRIYDAKGPTKGISTAAAILNPLTTESFLRKEAVAKKEDDEIAEVQRLCAVEPEGRACESHFLSDGRSNGTMANKGEVPPSVVSSRECLASLVEDTAEKFMGESLTGEASGEEVAQFATSILTANIKTTLVVKLLGARKDTKTSMGGRTVMSGARFGSMTGARHDRATRTHGSPRRQCARMHTRQPKAPVHAHSPHARPRSTCAHGRRRRRCVRGGCGGCGMHTRSEAKGVGRSGMHTRSEAKGVGRSDAKHIGGAGWGARVRVATCACDAERSQNPSGSQRSSDLSDLTRRARHRRRSDVAGGLRDRDGAPRQAPVRHLRHRLRPPSGGARGRLRLLRLRARYVRRDELGEVRRDPRAPLHTRSRPGAQAAPAR